LVDSAQDSHHIVPWLSTDEEGGGIARLAGVVGPLPWPRQLAEEYSPSQVRSVIETHAVALRALGITMDLAPVVDTAAATDGIGEEGLRSFSEDPTTTATYGIAFEAGLAAGGVTGVFKHFPGLGHANADTDLGSATDPPLADLVDDDLVPFARAAKAGVGVIMVGHPVVAGLTGGLPASLSPAAYQYLRRQIGFQGVAMTDSLDAGAISAAGYGLPAAAVAAIVAGADMVLFTDATAYPAVLAALEAAVASGQLSLPRVNTAVGRILVAKHLRPCPRNRKGEH
jgi:beta-N-acetylhexosaminidase